MAKYAFLYNTTTEDVAQTMNTMEYAVDLAEAGHDVEVYFDGSATEWPGFLAANPDNPVNTYYQQARDAGIVGGACGFCSNSFGQTQAVQDAGVQLLGDAETHGIDVAGLAEDGFELLVIT
jgi:hypothetical protein